MPVEINDAAKELLVLIEEGEQTVAAFLGSLAALHPEAVHEVLGCPVFIGYRSALAAIPDPPEDAA